MLPAVRFRYKQNWLKLQLKFAVHIHVLHNNMKSQK